MTCPAAIVHAFHTWSVSLASMTIVWGRHRLAEPVPFVGSGNGPPRHLVHASVAAPDRSITIPSCLGNSSLNSSSQRSRKNNRTNRFCHSFILCSFFKASNGSANSLSLDGSTISRSLSDGCCAQCSMVGRKVVRSHRDCGVSNPTFDRRHWMRGGKMSLSACRSNNLFQPRLKFMSGGKVTAHSTSL